MKTVPTLFMVFSGCLFVATAGLSCGQTVVTTAVDENDAPAGAAVSLREAVRDTPDGGVITFAPALNGNVCALQSGEMAVTGKTLTLNAGTLSNGFALTAQKRSRHFNIAAGAGLTLVKLELLDGNPGAGAAGGAILSAGTLSLVDCTLRSNAAGNGTAGANGTDGHGPSNPNGSDYQYATPGGNGTTGGSGGAVSSTGSLTALRCRFLSNRAGSGGRGGYGGGVWVAADGGKGAAAGSGGAVSSSGALSLANCFFDGNATGEGGVGAPGGYAYGPPEYHGRDGTGGDGGGGGAVAHSGDLTAADCTFSANWTGAAGAGANGAGTSFSATPGTGGSGGGLLCAGGTTVLTNCTFSRNETREGFASGNGSNGGAICSGANTVLRLVHCTVAVNRTAFLFPYPGDRMGPGKGGGVFTGGNTADIQNCLIAGNKVLTEEQNMDGTIAPAVSPPSIFTNVTVDPGLSGLTISGGGFTPVLPLLASSPARNGGIILNGGPPNDQRGLPRAEGLPDLGAVEMQATEPAGLKYQTISFDTPEDRQSGGSTAVPLAATASSTLPVVFSVVGGAAVLSGSILTVSGRGSISVKASQAGNGEYAPAIPVIRTFRVIGLSQNFVWPAIGRYFYEGTSYNLPAGTPVGQPVTYSVVSGAGTVTGNVLTPGGYSLTVSATAPGNAVYEPLVSTHTYTLERPRIFISLPGGGGQTTLQEGNPNPVTFIVSISEARSVPVPFEVVVSYAEGRQLKADRPLIIPAGASSLTFGLSLVDDMTSWNTGIGVIAPSAAEPYGPPPASGGSTIMARMEENDPAWFILSKPRAFKAGYPARISLYPVMPNGNPVYMMNNPVSFNVSAFSGATPVPVTPATAGPFDASADRSFLVTFPSPATGVKFNITSPFGAALRESEVAFDVGTDPDVDGDGVNDLVETALQTDLLQQATPPPLTVTRDASGQLHLIFARRPVNLNGWTVRTMISNDLIHWNPADAGTVTGVDTYFQKVDVLLPSSGDQWFGRLEVTPPP